MSVDHLTRAALALALLWPTTPRDVARFVAAAFELAALCPSLSPLHISRTRGIT